MRLHPSLLLLSLALTACEGGKTPQDGGLTQGPDGATDGDGDGYGENDCDDADAATNPGAVEICDGTDNNCDGTVDEGLTSVVAQSVIETSKDGIAAVVAVFIDGYKATLQAREVFVFANDAHTCFLARRFGR